MLPPGQRSAPEGVIVGTEFADDAAVVRLQEDEFFLAIGEGVHQARRSARLIAECGLPPDFPVPPAFVEGRYLKIKLLQLD